MESRKILLTYDYEPFLGAKSGSAGKCMLEPTNALSSIMYKYKVKAVFFVDMLYILNLKKHSELNNDFTAITNQLKALFAEGHYIFPHIHPHWLDAVYLKDEMGFSLMDISRYSLASLQKEIIRSLFKESIGCLNELGITYSEWGYRAGGWCIQPFSQLKDVFSSENIVFDFSVLPGCRNDSPKQAFDFSKVKENAPYFFSDAVEIRDDNITFVEFPISTIHFAPIRMLTDKIIRKYLWRIGDKGWGDGIGAQATPLKFNSKNQEMVAIELLNISKLSNYKKYIEREDYMHWISHPKMVTKHGLKMFDKFLKFATEKYNLVFDFHEMLLTV